VAGFFRASSEIHSDSENPRFLDGEPFLLGPSCAGQAFERIILSEVDHIVSQKANAMSISTMMDDDIPKPDFTPFDCSSPSPPSQRSDPHSPRSLSPSSRDSMRILLDLVGSVDRSISRLRDFSEHYFREDLTTLAIDHISRHVSDFRDLLAQISSQKEFAESSARDEIPVPAAFSIAPWRSSESEDWPSPSSGDWVEAVASRLRSTPPSFGHSREKAPLEERLANAERQRRKLENEKNRKIRGQTNKVRRAVELREERKDRAIASIAEKQDSAAQRREERLLTIRKRARSEVEKAQEGRFIQVTDIETRKLSLERTWSEASARRDEAVRVKSQDAKDRATKSQDSPTLTPGGWPVRFEIESVPAIPEVPVVFEKPGDLSGDARASLDRLRASPSGGGFAWIFEGSRGLEVRYWS
jgi:hypothetical protein